MDKSAPQRKNIRQDQCIWKTGVLKKSHFQKVLKFRAWAGVVVQKVKEFDNLSLIAGVHMVERESLLQRAGL